VLDTQSSNNEAEKKDVFGACFSEGLQPYLKKFDGWK